MPNIAPRALYMLTHVILYNLGRHLVGTYYHPHSWVNNLRHRTVKHLAQGHTASKRWRCQQMVYKTNGSIKSEAGTKGS